MRSAKRKNVPVGDAILAFFKSIGAGDRFRDNLAIAFWDVSVGEQIAAHTEPVEVRKGVMLVRVDDATWRQELMFHKFEIIEKINQKIGKNAIKEIKFY